VEELDPVKLLSYGAIGLGCILAILAFFLLRKEQDREAPRRAMLTSVYVFMAFSLALALAGFVSEQLRYSTAAALEAKGHALADLEAKAKDQQRDLDAAREKDQKMGLKLAVAQGVLKTALKQKEGALDRLRQAQPGDSAFPEVLMDLRRELETADKAISETLTSD
jgi:hypothetical protein